MRMLHIGLALPLALALILAGPAVAGAACEFPPEVAVPDGKTASQDDMTAARSLVQKYMQDMEGYLECLDQEAKALPPEQQTAEQKAVHVKRHNAAVDAMESVAARYNEQVRAFNAAK